MERPFEPILASYEEDCYHCQNEGLEPLTLDEFIRIIVEEKMVRRVCEARGHDLISTDTAGPETGSMGVRCVRCGFEDETILY